MCPWYSSASAAGPEDAKGSCCAMVSECVCVCVCVRARARFCVRESDMSRVMSCHERLSRVTCHIFSLQRHGPWAMRGGARKRGSNAQARLRVLGFGFRVSDIELRFGLATGHRRMMPGVC